ncbi:penicillin-binding protein 1B [Photobacterium damselae]|uniref:penicillin-binding protein 1B n=1 Tax=Photobacterium damselae TaxID=38293 RepID=UPI0002F425C8|nr:penicillin-binding protein 1B [Photobacterium damselae]OLQ79620.1 penicillin-binding protein 1B [Photobacterium damselae subsp. piscicida]
MTSNNSQSGLPEQDSQHTKQPSKLKKVLLRSLIAAALVGGAGAVYVGHQLNEIVTAKFSSGQLWKLPSVVYARELTLQPGSPISYKNLLNELRVLHYTKVKKPDESGEYSANGWRIEFVRRPFQFKEGAEGARDVAVTFDGNSIKQITDLDKNQELGFLRMDPKMLGMLESRTPEQRIYVPADKMPKELVNGLIATEDRHFYEHDGISLVGIARAFIANIKAGHTVQGGSTLTQQLAKNMFLSSERSLWRKAKEAYMAIIIDARYGKQEVLDAYMNQVYLAQNGNHGIHGFALASRYYFGRPLSELRIDQMALMIGLVKGPSYYNPWRYPERAKERRNVVLKLMADNNVITQEQYQDAIKLPLDIQAKGELSKRQPAYFGQIRAELEEKVGDAFKSGEGLRLFTSLDPQSQDAADQAVKKMIPIIEKQRAGKDLETAMVIADRKTGEIRAMIGSSNPGYAGYNRAIDAQRQIGSVVKPAIYLTALAQPEKYSLTTTLEDKPLSIKLSNGDVWKPRNYSRTFSGQVPLFLALAKSMNVPTVNLGMALGVENVIKTMVTLGVDANDIPDVPAILLGAVALSPLQVAQMYQTITNEGAKAPLTALNAVVDEKGDVLYQNWPKAAQVVPPQAAWLTTYDMQQVVKQGTARSLGRMYPNMHLAGKTGTTDQGKDSWFVGADGREVVAVWMGRDDNKSANLTGSTGALRLYEDYIKRRGPEPLELRLPANITGFNYDVMPDGTYQQSCTGTTRLPVWDPNNDLKIDCSVPVQQQVKEHVQEAQQQVEGFFNRLFNW